jgi:hypothetical protein
LKRTGTLLENLRQFLFEHIADYEHLDVLTLLAREPQRVWSAAEAAQSLGLELEVCRSALTHLSESGLLATRSGAEAFHYAPANETLARHVETLIRVYQEHRVEVVRMMSTNAVERVRTAAIRAFSGAFHLRGPKK